MDRLLETISTDLERWHGEPGAVFYSGRSTLVKGHYYLMGLNPGGDPDNIKDSLQETLKKWQNESPNWSEYCDETWEYTYRGMKREWKKGHAPHQQRVRRLCRVLYGQGEDEQEVEGQELVRRVFSANAIFVRTKDSYGLASQQHEELSQCCWRVHQLLLAKVKPKLVVCLGNNTKLSSFSILQQRLNKQEYKYCGDGCSYHDGKWFDATIMLSSTNGSENLHFRIVGIPHPSHFDPLRSEKLRRFLTEESERIRKDG